MGVNTVKTITTWDELEEESLKIEEWHAAAQECAAELRRAAHRRDELEVARIVDRWADLKKAIRASFKISSDIFQRDIKTLRLLS